MQGEIYKLAKTSVYISLPKPAPHHYPVDKRLLKTQCLAGHLVTWKILWIMVTIKNRVESSNFQSITLTLAMDGGIHLLLYLASTLPIPKLRSTNCSTDIVGQS